MAGAGECEQQTIAFEQTHRVKIDVLVAAGGAIDLHPFLGEGGRIADDETESLARRGQLPHVAERIGDGEAGDARGSIQLMIAPCLIDGHSRSVDVFHERRAAGDGVDAKRSRVGEKVQHALARRQ